ncbi:wsv228 [White spot syndrome virus]|uniref:Wsv228 n=4 Tax=White spot syndrome virus TaxID=342409 RepID=Q8VAY8_WSSVS|nr:wsv228 [Shrimp white spot syndrome virus]AFX59605.1 wsv228 [White spot syndrome virus]AAL33232.1 wsv228 [Shrimp white spot syndrome virus]AAL89151.1 WSSV283 [Shrimp white spot syndrome virus]AWQ60399.1 wsv228 [Shrimp white spot syndrome virus]AWQ60814.1 wsv228 [Shrimp white spot syndrome virus]
MATTHISSTLSLFSALKYASSNTCCSSSLPVSRTNVSVYAGINMATIRFWRKQTFLAAPISLAVLLDASSQSRARHSVLLSISFKYTGEDFV